MRWRFSLKGLGSKFQSDRLVKIPVFIALVAAGLVGWHLGSWTGGLGPDELVLRASSASLHHIFNDPTNAPYNLAAHYAHKISPNSTFWLRAPAAAITAIGILLFYNLTRPLFGKIMAICGSLLLATLPLVLVNGRTAGTSVTYLLIVPVAATYLWLIGTKTHKRQALIYLAAMAAIALYTPGMVWFIILGVGLARKQLIHEFKAVKNKLFLASLAAVCACLIAPLVWGIYNQPAIARDILALPAHWQPPVDIFKSIAWMGLSIFWRTPEHHSQIIGRLPVLNIVQLTLAIIGSYALWQRLRHSLFSVAGFIGLAVVLAAINSNYLLLMYAVLPIALLQTVGLRYLYVQWRSVFPRNPIPKALSLFMILAVVGVNILYGVRYSLIAWPHTVETRNLYVLK